MGTTGNMLSQTCQADRGNHSIVNYMKPWKQNAVAKSNWAHSEAFRYNTYHHSSIPVIRLRKKIKSKQGDTTAISLHQTRRSKREQKAKNSQLFFPSSASPRPPFVLLHPHLCSALRWHKQLLSSVVSQTRGTNPG